MRAPGPGFPASVCEVSTLSSFSWAAAMSLPYTTWFFRAPLSTDPKPSLLAFNNSCFHLEVSSLAHCTDWVCPFLVAAAPQGSQACCELSKLRFVGPLQPACLGQPSCLKDTMRTWTKPAPRRLSPSLWRVKKCGRPAKTTRRRRQRQSRAPGTHLWSARLPSSRVSCPRRCLLLNLTWATVPRLPLWERHVSPQ